MKKGFTVFPALMILFITACCAGEGADRLNCAVYSFLPDPAYDQELIERRRAEIEPDFPLIRAEWNCYTDGAPQYLLRPRKSPYPAPAERFPSTLSRKGWQGLKTTTSSGRADPPETQVFTETEQRKEAHGNHTSKKIT